MREKYKICFNGNWFFSSNFASKTFPSFHWRNLLFFFLFFLWILIEMQINGILFHRHITCLKMSVNVEKCETATKLFNDTALSWHQKDFFSICTWVASWKNLSERGVRNISGSSYVSSRNDTFHISKEFYDGDKYTWCVCCFQLQQGTQIIPRQYRLTDKLILMSYHKWRIGKISMLNVPNV